MSQTLPKIEAIALDDELDDYAVRQRNRHAQRAAEVAAGLRRLADFIEAHPELDGDLAQLRHQQFNIPVGLRGQAREGMAAFARAALRAGVEVKKDIGEKWAGVNLDFGITLSVYAARDEVCEKVVTGTREVTEQVPDPDALAAVPTVEVTKVVEDVEWRCSPLLAAGLDADR